MNKLRLLPKTNSSPQMISWRCTLLQSRVDADSKKVVLIWSISSGNKNELIQAVTVPAGVSVKEGVRLFIGDAEPLTMSYDICGARVCIAKAPLDDKLVGIMKASQKASASYVQMSKQLLQVNLELTGFAAPCQNQARWFLEGRIGRISGTAHPEDARWYASVVEEGPVAPGDAVTLL